MGPLVTAYSGKHLDLGASDSLFKKKKKEDWSEWSEPEATLASSKSK